MEGALVKKGDLLFEIDPRSFKNALDQADGQLAQAKARLGKTELDVKRYTPLAKEGAISKQELDDAIQANLACQSICLFSGSSRRAGQAKPRLYQNHIPHRRDRRYS